MPDVSPDRIGTWAVVFGGLFGALAGLGLLRLTQEDQPPRLAHHSPPGAAFYHEAAPVRSETPAEPEKERVMPSPGKPPRVQTAGFEHPAQPSMANHPQAPGSVLPSDDRLLASSRLGAGAAPLPQRIATPDLNALTNLTIRPITGPGARPRQAGGAASPKPAPPGGPQPEAASQVVRRGLHLADARRWTDALAASDRALQLNPRRGDAHRLRGLALAGLGRLDEAMAEYRRAADLQPDDPRPAMSMGDVCYDRGRWAEAIEHYSAAMRLQPGAVASYNRGSSYLALGALDQAIEDFNQAVGSTSPIQARAFANRGYALHLKGRIDQALADYDEAIRRDPADALALSNRASAYHALGRLDRAVEDYSRALKLQPDDARTYADRASTYLALGDFDRAIRDYDEAIRRAPDLADASRGRAIALRRKARQGSKAHGEPGTLSRIEN